MTDNKIAVGQTWLFCYDVEKKKSDRYPHSLGFTLTLAPGESQERRLGESANKIEEGLTIFEGEVTHDRACAPARAGEGDRAGESLDLVVEPWSDDHKSPPKARIVAGFASRVAFDDGKRFENQNLDEDFAWPKPEVK